MRTKVVYSPNGITRAREFAKDLRRWVALGYISSTEADAYVARAIRMETSDPTPNKIQCRVCQNVHAIVGVAQAFECCGIVQSISDSRA